LDEHVRQLADSIKRLLGKQVMARPLLFAAPPSMPPLPHAQKNIKIDLKDIRVGGKPFQEWAREPKHAAILACFAVILIGVLWYVFRPTATPEDRQAWNMAAMTDTIAAYQLYMREQPGGYFEGRAEDRVEELTTQVNQAFAKARQMNTPQAYASFIQTYGRQGVDLAEAQEAYVKVNAQEGQARNAYRQAISSRSRQAYQTFLASYGGTSYAADVRQRMASCHNEVRNSGTTQTSELRESATATSSDPNTACNEARVNAAGHAQQECTAQQGRPGGVRVLSQRTGTAAPDAGRVAGQVLGSTLFGNRNYNYNTPAQYQCMAEVAASCLRTSNSARTVEICQ
jgi:cbb3-type cytochrome oxidase subunit 3